MIIGAEKNITTAKRLLYLNVMLRGVSPIVSATITENGTKTDKLMAIYQQVSSVRANAALVSPNTVGLMTKARSGTVIII
jgi:uncharacterized membrane protein